MKPRIKLRTLQGFQGMPTRSLGPGTRCLSSAEQTTSAETSTNLQSEEHVLSNKNAFVRHRDWWNAKQKKLMELGKPHVDPETPHFATIRPTKAWCKTRLRSILDPVPAGPSSSKNQQPRPDPLELYPVVQAAHKAEFSDILEPRLADIAHGLHLRPTTVWQPAEQRKVALLLGYCWSRAYELESQRNILRKGGQAAAQFVKETDVRRCVEYLATFLIREVTSGDASRATALYEILKKALEEHRRRNQAFFLPTPLMAALIVCRSRAGIDKNFKLDARFPEIDKAVQYIAKVLDIELSAAKAEYGEAAERLLEIRSEVILPSGIWPLRKQLRHFAEMRDYQSRIDTWKAFRNKAVIENDNTPDTLMDPKIRIHVLGAFLQSLLTPAANRRAGVYGDLERCSAEVLEMIPRPYPREVIHTLLARRAGVSQSDVTDANPDSTLPDRKAYTLDERKGIQADMEVIWNESEKSGRDIKMYLIYIEALGRLGSLRELQSVWNQLANDKVAKELYFKDEPSSGKVFPPTRSLNHMISSCLLVPGGHSTAMELFKQACRPDSTVPVDIVTINTLLRHYVRKDEIAEMTELFALSERMKVAPDVVTYTTLLQGLLRSGQFDMARKVMSSMTKAGVEPNPRMCSMLVADLAKQGDSRGLEAAEEMLREMRRLRMDLNEVTWTALISGYFRGGWDQDAWEAIRRMEADGVKLNRIGYNLILKQAANNQKVIGERGESWPLKLYRKMRADGIMPNNDTFVILLDGLCRTERWQEADKIVMEIGKLEFVAEKGSLVSVLKRVRMRRKEAKK